MLHEMTQQNTFKSNIPITYIPLQNIFGSELWGSYQRYNDNMGSFCDFGCVLACHISAANHVKN